MLIKDLVCLSDISKNFDIISSFYFRDELLLQSELIDYIGLNKDTLQSETSQIKDIVKVIREKTKKILRLTHFYKNTAYQLKKV